MLSSTGDFDLSKALSFGFSRKEFIPLLIPGRFLTIYVGGEVFGVCLCLGSCLSA